MTIAMPGVRPSVPHFSSGPCAKRPGWSLQALTDAVLGRSHRVEARQGEAQARHRSHPRSARSPGRLPHRHRAGVRHRRGRNGAVVAARARARSPCWPGNPSAKAGSPTSSRQLKLKDVDRRSRPAMANCPISRKVDLASDVVFTWNGTTSGVRVPNADWIAADRAGPHHLRRDLGRLRAAARLGRSSMSSPSPGRRRSAAKPRTAC